MGTGASTETPDEGDFVCYKIVTYEYEKLKELYEILDISPLSDEIVGKALETLYIDVKSELETPLEECTIGSVIAFKYNQLNIDDKKSYEQLILDTAVEKEKKLKSLNKNNQKNTDYEAGFGGTAADSKNEAEAAKLLRGADENETNPDLLLDEEFPLLNKNKLRYYHSLNEKTVRLSGKWKKYMGLVSNCYTYIHVLTREVVSICPPDYEEEEVKVDKMEEVDPRVANPSNGLCTVGLENLLAKIEEVVKNDEKTPLLLETSQEQYLRSYFSYKGVVADCSSLTIPFAKGGVKRNELMEDCRKKLVQAMKVGSVFALYLGNVTIDHADFKTKLCKKVRTYCFIELCYVYLYF